MADRANALTITVAPAVLRWARQRAALEPEELARRVNLSLERVVAWEETGELPFTHLQRLAEKTHTPVGYLFLPEPPAERLPVADFRRPDGPQPPAPSPELLDTIHECQQRQAWFREYLEAIGEQPVHFIGRASTNMRPEEVAADIRHHLRLDEDPTSIEPTWQEALAELYRRVEGVGVLVMRNGVVGNNTHRHLRVDEFRGFSLADPFAPLVFVNSADAKSAQMFTLIHELAHLWLGQSAVSDADPTTTRADERFCNEVAAEVLVPASLLREMWHEREDREAQVARLARRFKVSARVILIRAREAGLLGPVVFRALYEAEEARERRAAKKTKSGGDFYNTQNSRLGRRFARAVVVSALEGRTGYTEAYRLLNVRSGHTFDELARKLGVKL